MKIKSAQFLTSVRDPAECPVWARPEFALIGRSNVGKSSMINMLANRESLAKVSATPGKTRLLNFFLMNEAWCLVDLPGYGFAKIAKSERFDFNELVGDYLQGRVNLVRVFVLVDARLAPQGIDLDFIEWLAATGVAYSLVFNKVDKQSPTKTRLQMEQFLAALAERTPAAEPIEVLTSSTKTKDGRSGILRAIDACLSAPR